MKKLTTNSIKISIKKLNKYKEEMAILRDKFRTELDEVTDIFQTLDETTVDVTNALRELQNAMDTMSQYV